MGQEKLPGIQIARAVAALSIAYFHSWVALLGFPKDTAHPIYVLANYGWLAVDVFFAISGFVICVTASRENFSPKRFLINRALRLYPLWWLALGTFVYLSYMWTSRPVDIGYLLHSATLLPTKEFPLLDVGWSLQHEMMFYLSAAVIVPLFGIYGIVVALTISTIAFHSVEMPWYFANLAMYHAEFLAGVLAFLARPWLKRFGPLVPLIIGAGAMYFFVGVWGGRYWAPVSLFFLVTGFANIQDTKSRSMGFGVLLGDASYSIYLWHPLVFKLAYVATGRTAFPVWSQEAIRFGAIALIIAISLASYRWFERPINSLRLSPTKQKTAEAPSERATA
jgi:peptidoglycan/LPS O-acetylase OafA/YrhL